MTVYEYLRNISAPRLAVVLGYIADTNPGNNTCCPLRQLGKCKFMSDSYDCCESWASYLMEEMSEHDKAFWNDVISGEITFTQKICDDVRIENRRNEK